MMLSQQEEPSLNQHDDDASSDSDVYETSDEYISDPDYDPELMNEDLGLTRGVPKGQILHNLNNYI